MSAAIRQAAVLCAGEGRRLRPFTERVPKPLLPLLGAPLVEHVAWSLARAGVERIVVNAWWRAERIVAWAASDPVPGVEIEVVREAVLRGTGGGLMGLAEHLDDAPAFVATADVVGEVDWQALAEHHRRVDALATMAVAARGDVERYGRVVARDGRLADVVGLVDERAAAAPDARVGVNASWHVVEPEFVARLPARPPSCLVRDGYVAALEAGEPVGAWVHDGAWAEVGTPDLLVAAHVAALTDELPLDGDLAARAGRHVDTLSRVADGATVGRDARLVRTVVGAGATVGAGAVLRDCVVMDGADVSSGSEHVGELIAPHGVAP